MKYTDLIVTFHHAQIAINVSVERDWVTTIARGNSESLTRLNVFVLLRSAHLRIFSLIFKEQISATDRPHLEAPRPALCVSPDHRGVVPFRDGVPARLRPCVNGF